MVPDISNMSDVSLSPNMYQGSDLPILQHNMPNTISKEATLVILL